MSGFLEKFNTDDVFIRSLILGLVRLLKDKVSYLQTNDRQEVLEVHVPFVYSMAGDESFLKDNFVDVTICEDDEKKIIAEGNYDVIPRGVVVFNTININPAGLTNKYVRNTYTKEDIKGNVKTFSSYVNNIPLNVDFSVRIRVDTLLDSFKIFQALLGTFTKVDEYMFEFDGTRIPVQVGFPETYDNDKQFEFTYLATQHHIELTFNLMVETYFPQRDLATERFRGNLMQAGIKVQTDVGSNLDSDESLIN